MIVSVSGHLSRNAPTDSAGSRSDDEKSQKTKTKRALMTSQDCVICLCRLCLAKCLIIAYIIL